MPGEIARIILFVKDMAAMLAFYEETLGLKRSASPNDDDNFITLDAGSVQLALHRIPPRYARDIEISDPPKPRSGIPVKFAFRVEDVDASRAQLVARGARMRKIQSAGEIRFCDGIDPEGNLFQISNRP